MSKQRTMEVEYKFSVDYNKTPNVSCGKCDTKIGDGIKFQAILENDQVDAATHYHEDCFFETHSLYSDSDVQNVDNMKTEDLNRIQEKIDKKVFEKIAEQTQKFNEMRKYLHKNCDSFVFNHLLRTNSACIYEPRGNSKRILNQMTDYVVFGKPTLCSRCNSGPFVFNGKGYVCQNYMTDWAKCLNFEKFPKKERFQMPDWNNPTYQYLRNLDGPMEKRAIRPKSRVEKIQQPKNPRNNNHLKQNGILYGLSFVILELREKRKAIRATIDGLGGKIVKKVHKNLAAVISTKEQIKRNKKKIKRARDLQIQVVPDSYVDALKEDPAKALELIVSCNIADWGSDPIERTRHEKDKELAKGKLVEDKVLPEKIKLSLKGGHPVDPGSELVDVAHVLSNAEHIFSYVCTLVDAGTNENDYFKLELLESDKGDKFWIYTSRGRIGTTIGNSSLDYCGKDRWGPFWGFKSRFYSPTSNNFGPDLKKMPGKFFPIKTDYTEEYKIYQQLDEAPESKLPEPVIGLLQLIAKTDEIKTNRLEFELDTDLMPLGKLSQNEIESGENILQELRKIIEADADYTKIMDGTNRFFSKIPHNFGVGKVPLLDSIEKIDYYLERINRMKTYRCDFNVIKTETLETCDKNAVDEFYEKLDVDLTPLTEDSDEFQLIKKYIENTETHIKYKLVIEDIFKIRNKMLEDRYEKYKNYPNRKLLWNGSRIIEVLDHLKNGFPLPTQEENPYSITKNGIFFTDSVTPANAHEDKDTQLLFLAEVALGELFINNGYETVKELPEGKDSYLSGGKEFPDPEQSYFCDDGVEIPLGKMLENKKNSHGVNWFYIFKTEQFNLKYLVRATMENRPNTE